MTYAKKTGGTNSTPTTNKRASGGSWVDMQWVKRRISGAWTQVWPLALITDQVISSAGTSLLASTSRYKLNTSGIVEKREGTLPYETLETWLLSGAASDYEVRATDMGTITGLGSPSGTTGVWLSLGTSREWSLSVPNSGEQDTWLLFIEIRTVSDNVVVTSANITLDSERI